MEEKNSQNEQRGKCSEWTAWHDHMPGSTPTLHVKGSCEFPTEGFSVKLKPKNPQGFNPAIYILERIVDVPNGPVGDIVTTEEVHYTEDTSTVYSHVHIMPDDKLIEVENVH